MRLMALLLLFAPVLFLTYWHVFQWGGGLGRLQWAAGRVLPALALVAYGTWILLVDSDVLSVLLGSGARRGGLVPLIAFVLAGSGAGIAMFPQAAASLSPWYTKLAKWQMTRDFAVVGWCLMGVSALVVVIVARAMR